MRLVKIKNSIFVIFFASIILSSSVIGVFLYNQPSQENSANKKDNSENDGNQPILQLNLSTLSMKNNQDRKWDENDENTYSHRKDYGNIDFIQTDHDDNIHGDNSDCYIEESDDNNLINAYYLIRELIREKGILFYDVLKRINSDPVNTNFSDETTYSSEVSTLFCKPIVGINVTFYVFKRTDSYPQWITKHSILSKIYDHFWFYLYYYDSPELVEYLNSSYIGRWFLSKRAKIFSHFWVEQINTNITDINGLSRINQYVYYSPGKYNIITVANIKDFSNLIFSGKCDCIDNSFYGKCCTSKCNIDFLLFRIFYDHLTVKEEHTQIELVSHNARYSDISKFTVHLTDDENYPLLKPYPWNHDNYETNNSILISDEVDVDYYVELPQSSVYIGTATTDAYGYATLSVPIWIKPGVYNMTVKFEGNTCYLPTSATSEIIVKKEKTKIEPIQLYSVNNTDTLNISAQLLDDEGNGIPQSEDLNQEGRLLSFYIEVDDEWKLIGECKTDSGGWCYIITSFLLPYGIYPFNVVYEGDDYYLPAERVGTIEIKREQTILRDLEDINIQTTDSIVLIANLTDNEFIPITYKAISFSILIGMTWYLLGTSFTNEKGLVEFIWHTTTAPGTYVIKAEFSQDEYFVGSKAYAIATIEKEDTEIIIFKRLSDSYGKYDIITKLVEDDPQQTPIPNEKINVWINGNKYDEKTDDDGNVKISIPINTFEDISIEAEYDGSSYFKPSSEDQVKKFDEEWDFFNEYSLDMLVSLFEDYSNLDTDKISSVANVFFNFKEDIKDDKLDDILNVVEFLNLIDSPYFVEPWSNFFEIRDYKYFLCHWTNGKTYMPIVYSSIYETLIHNVLFQNIPEEGESVNVGTRFDFEWTFINAILSREAVYEWEKIAETSSLSRFLNWIDMAWNAFLDAVDADEDEDDVFTYYKGGYKYRVSVLIGFIFEWAKKYEEVFDYWDYEYFNPTVTDFFKISIPDDDDLEELWDTTKYGLFWHYIEDLLYLGFDYVKKQFEMQVDSIIYLLSLIGIDVYEILDDVLEWLNKEKAEEYKTEISDYIDNHFNDILSDVKAKPISSIPDDLNLGKYATSDYLSIESNTIGLFDINQIDLNQDLTEEDLIQEITALLRTYGIELNSDDLFNIIDELEDQIGDYTPLYQPNYLIDIDEVNSQIQGITKSWTDINDITFSDLNSICLLDIFEEVPNTEVYKTIDEFLTRFDIVPYVKMWAEIIIDLLAGADILFNFRSAYHVYLAAALIILAVIVFFDFHDALKGQGEGVGDDLGIIIVGFLGLVFARMAKEVASKSGLEYEETIAEYFYDNLVYVPGSTIWELYIEGFYGEVAGDYAFTILETFISIMSTFWVLDHFKKHGEWIQYVWYTLNILLCFPDALSKILEKNKYSFAAGIICELIAFGSFWIIWYDLGS